MSFGINQALVSEAQTEAGPKCIACIHTYLNDGVRKKEEVEEYVATLTKPNLRVLIRFPQCTI
jgi:hypothetical protein